MQKIAFIETFFNLFLSQDIKLCECPEGKWPANDCGTLEKCSLFANQTLPTNLRRCSILVSKSCDKWGCGSKSTRINGSVSYFPLMSLVWTRFFSNFFFSFVLAFSTVLKWTKIFFFRSSFLWIKWPSLKDKSYSYE